MTQSEAYQMVEERIAKAKRLGAKELDLSVRYGDTVPRLTELPESLSQLTELQILHLSGNRLAILPEWLGQLGKLRMLDFSFNQLTTLPESLRQLTLLNVLNLYGNQLTVLPEWIGHFKHLQKLILYFNRLTTLPESLGQLTQLKTLDLSFNKLTTLPDSLGSLEELEEFNLKENPLNIELAGAYGNGALAVKRYLHEMAKGGKARYEAKLLILGDGNEGKTCVSRALRGLEFAEQCTTHGVDIEQWKFTHPDDVADKGKEITLNIWDFEGQEISHQTHQFFLTSQSLYLVVFKCRDQFLMDRAEYWLDTIRARAPRAKVVIVISQCEERSPHVPLDRIKAQYSDMLAETWFFPVDCKSGKNIDKLKTFLQRSAADLEFMGARWPRSYQQAELAIQKTAGKGTTHLSRAALDDILQKAGVNWDNYDGAAGAMARIGAITHFPDSPELSDFVILKPQWLTKAISKVMEDGQLSSDKGEIEMKRMKTIWNEAGYREMFSIFHDCMKEFELCYDLEDQSHCSLVPLRFGYVAPFIPWNDTPGLKERRMEYKLNIRPPMGIMSRFIVKTHHMIVKTVDNPKGVYWYNGVFLRTNSPFPSEALCEFAPDERILRVQVRAAFPQNMCEQIHGYIQAVFSFFTGLTAERSYGCIIVNEKTGRETQCSGLHTEKRIFTEIAMDMSALGCEFGFHRVDPRLLVSGFSSFGDFISAKLTLQDVREMIRNEMDKRPRWMDPFLRNWHSLLGWVRSNSNKLDQVLHSQANLSAEFKQEAELKMHEYFHCISELLDDRDHAAAPGLISIRAKDRSTWNPTSYFEKDYVLTPYCECEGYIHACEDGSVEFTKDRVWWEKTAPWIARGTNLLAAGLQLAYAGMPLVLGKDAAKLIEDEVKFMGALTKHLQLMEPENARENGSEALIDGGAYRDLRGDDRETVLARASLARFLEETAPDNYRARRWGSLRRVRMSDHSYRWLCEVCLKRNR